MYLRKLVLPAFGCFVACQHQFHPGFNLITGPNGAGKSTLSLAILKCLFTSISTQKGMAPFQPWDSAEGPAVSLDFRSDSGKEITVERDWGAGASSFTVDSNVKHLNRRQWESLLHEEIGVSNDSIFAGTVFVAQDQLESSLWEPQQLADAIERLVLSNGGAHSGEILDRLDKERRSLRVGLRAQARSPGPISVLNSKLNDLQSQLELHDSNKTRHDDAQTTLMELGKLLKKLKEQRDVLVAEVQFQERKLKILGNLNRLEEVDTHLTNVLQQVEALELKVREIRKERDAEVSQGLGITLGEILGTSCVGLSMLLFGINAFTNRDSGFLYFLAALLLLASILLILVGRRKKQTTKEVAQVSSLAEITHLEDLKKALLEGRPEREFIEMQLENRQAKEMAASQLEEPTLVALPAITQTELDEKRERASDLTTKVAETSGEFQSLEGMVSVLGESSEITLRAREKKQELETERDRLLQRTQVYALAHEVIAQARTQAIQGIMGNLGPAVSSELGFLTAGRYPKVTFDAALQVRVQNPTHSNWIFPAMMSAGTRDQVNLSIRLGLMSLLFESHKLPLFLDDPLVRFDASRRAAAGETLKRLSLDRQVLYFSHSSDFAPLADNVIELAPVTVGLHL